MTGRLLIVDDEVAQMRALCDTLGREGYTTQGHDSPTKALAALQPGQFDLLLTDLTMPEMDGIALIAAVRKVDPEVGAIVMTGHGTIDTAVRAMRNGALDYILKPFRLNVVLPVLVRAQDLQRLRRENAALQRLDRQRAEELAAAYQDLESFTYSISHDLRAPLLFVKDFATRLERDHQDQLDDEAKHILQVITAGCRNMDEMVVGLLEFSRTTSQPPARVQLDMTPIVKTAVNEARARFPHPRAVVEIGTLPPAAADPALIRHVWANLLGNAFKYSAQREQPVIKVSGRTEGSQTIYTVEDNGVGFDMQYADRLFAVFKRLHNSREYPGTGVGLAIAQRIVDRHGGSIGVHAEPDVGARFEFTLPSTVPAGELTAAADPSSN
jgi:signal transduction histidine kinase